MAKSTNNKCPYKLTGLTKAEIANMRRNFSFKKLFQTLHNWVRKAARVGLTKKQKRTIGTLIVSIVIVIIIGVIVAKPLITIISHPGYFKNMAGTSMVGAGLAYTLIIAVQTVFAIIPGEPLEIGGGYAFGFMWGSILCLLGHAIGSAITFLAVKRWGKQLVNLFVSDEQMKSVSYFNNGRRRNTLAFLLMFIPGTPKELITYVMGLTPMTLTTWLLLSTPARIPSVVTSTLSGATFADGKTGLTIVILSITLIISAFGMLYYFSISQQAKEAAAFDNLVAKHKAQEEIRERNAITAMD